MYWNEKMKQKLKVLTVVIIGVIVSVLLWYGCHFYFNPVEEYRNFTAQGVLIYDTVPADYKNVDVEVNAKTYYYLFGNEPDSIQGNIWMEGKGIFGYGDADEIGFYLEFHNNEKYCCAQVRIETTQGCMIAASRELQHIICGITVANESSEKQGQKGNRKALLVIPSEDIENAKEIIDEVSAESVPFSKWLSETMTLR